MKKIFCYLIGFGMLLLYAACSGDKTVISSEVQTPDELADVSADTRCVVSDPNHPDDSLHGCYYSSEMWNRSSGYRVQTGFDNGTNTSGIWYWSINTANGRKIQVNWNQHPDSSYDSLSLSSVIDRCHGSLCGVVVFDAVEASSSSDSDSSSFFVEFGFAGKDASGKFDAVDARDMQGVCLEYFADAMRMELDLGDSLNALMDGVFYGVDLPSYPVLGTKENFEGNKICFPWEQFVLPKASAAEGVLSIEEAVSHLQGLRFTMSTSQDYAVINNFDIISIGRYSGTPAGTVTALPVNENCEVVSVKDNFSVCGFSENQAKAEGYVLSVRYIKEKLFQAISDGQFMSTAAETCVGSIGQDYSQVLYWNVGCVGSRPRTLVCADGSESLSQEFFEAQTNFNARSLEIMESYKPSMDSLYAECLSLRDTLFNGEPIPDSCRIDQILYDRKINYLDYTDETYFAAEEEFNAKMDSLYRVDSLDEATRYCVLQHMPRSSRMYAPVKPSMAPAPVIHPLVKKVRCKSGNVYYADEYKDFLQELGIQDDTDSLEVFNAGKKYYLQFSERWFDTCVEEYGKDGAMWEGVWTRVNTGFDNGTGTSGKWFYETDSAYGGNSYIKWNNDYVVKDWNDPNALDSVLLKSSGLEGHVHFVKGDTMTMEPFVSLGFWLAGENGKGDHDAVDITDKKGICFDHAYSDAVVSLQLDMGDSLNEAVEWDLFNVRMYHSLSMDSDCYEWDQFDQDGWGKRMDLEEALKHVVGIKFHFVGSEYNDKIVDFGIYRIYFLNQ